MRRLLYCMAALYIVLGSVMCSHVEARCGVPAQDFKDAGP